MKSPEIRGGWKSAALVGLATLVLPFAITTCLWRTFGAASVVHPNAPTLFNLQFRALPPFLLLAGMNAAFVYTPRTRFQKWLRLLSATLLVVVTFCVAEWIAFAKTFEAAEVPRNAGNLFVAASAAGLASLAVPFILAGMFDSALTTIRARHAAKTKSETPAAPNPPDPPNPAPPPAA